MPHSLTGALAHVKLLSYPTQNRRSSLTATMHGPCDDSKRRTGLCFLWPRGRGLISEKNLFTVPFSVPVLEPHMILLDRRLAMTPTTLAAKRKSADPKKGGFSKDFSPSCPRKKLAAKSHLSETSRMEKIIIMLYDLSRIYNGTWG